MNKSLPLTVTAASVAALMGTQAHSAATGEEMAVSGSIVASGSAAVFPGYNLTLGGTGTISGSAFFDDSGFLQISQTIVNDLTQNGGPTPSTITTTTQLNGTFTGTTFTTDGTSNLLAAVCTGDANTCNNLPGTGPALGGEIFSVDTETGGSWVFDGAPPLGGSLSVLTTTTLSPVPSGGGSTGGGSTGGGTTATGDAHPVPTLPLYGIALTMLGLSFVGSRRLHNAARKK